MVEAGNVFFKSIAAAGQEGQKDQAVRIAKAYRHMGYDGVGLSPIDLAAGATTIAQLSSYLPLISANIVLQNDSPAVRPFLVRTIEKNRLIIVGLTGQPNFPLKDFKILEWQEVLPDLLENFTEEDAFIILLSTLSPEDNHAIARHYPQIRLIIGTNHGKGNKITPLSQATLYAQTGPEGKYLGELKCKLLSGTSWLALAKASLPQLLAKQNRLVEAIQKSQQGDENTTRHARLIRSLNLTKEQIKIWQAAENGPNKQDGYSSAMHRIVPQKATGEIKKILEGE